MVWAMRSWKLGIALIVTTQLFFIGAAVYLIQNGFRKLIHSQDKDNEKVSTLIIGLGLTYLTAADPLGMEKRRLRMMRCLNRYRRLLENTDELYDNEQTNFLAKEVEKVLDYSCSEDGSSWYTVEPKKE